MIQVVLGMCGREGHKALDCSFQRRGKGMRMVRGGECKTQNTDCCLHRFFLRYISSLTSWNWKVIFNLIMLMKVVGGADQWSRRWIHISTQHGHFDGHEKEKDLWQEGVDSRESHGASCCFEYTFVKKNWRFCRFGILLQMHIKPSPK